FLENKAIEKGAGPNWLSDIDSLTKSINYVPVDACTNSTNLSGTKDAASQEVKLSMLCEALSKEISSSILRFHRLIPLVSKGDATMIASCKTCWSSSPLRHYVCMWCTVAFGCIVIEERFHTAKTFNLVWIWLGGDYGNSEYNVDFHLIVDFVEASPLRQFWSTARIETTEEGTKILATVDGILKTITESSLRRNLKLQDDEGGEGSGTPTEPHHTPSPEAQPTSSTTPSSPTLPSVTTAPIPTITLSDTPPLRKYTSRTKIAQSSVLPPAADEPAFPLRDVSKGEACPTDSGFGADQDRANIAKTSTLPYDSAPKVTSPAADEGTQEREIHRLKARVKLLEDKGVVAERFGDDAPIKGRNLDKGEVAAERASDDTEEMATVLTSMDATTILASGVAEVSTGSGSIPTVGPPATEVPT
nr:hypothetical protein [Tanacetum cinerariifolium]